MAESHFTCPLCIPKFPKLGIFNVFSDVNLDVKGQEFELGNGRRTSDPEEAYNCILERDFPEYNFEDGKQAEVLFTPPIYLHQRMDISMAPKGILETIIGMIFNQGTKGQIEGDHFEEHVFNCWKSFFSSVVYIIKTFMVNCPSSRTHSCKFSR
jgi:hypothetical protein